MFYEEKIINGVLCRRYAPNEPWKPFTLEEMASKYQNQKEDFKDRNKAAIRALGMGYLLEQENSMKREKIKVLLHRIVGATEEKGCVVVPQKPEEDMYGFNSIAIPLNQIVEVEVDHEIGSELQTIARATTA